MPSRTRARSASLVVAWHRSVTSPVERCQAVPTRTSRFEVRSHCLSHGATRCVLGGITAHSRASLLAEHPPAATPSYAPTQVTPPLKTWSVGGGREINDHDNVRSNSITGLVRQHVIKGDLQDASVVDKRVRSTALESATGGNRPFRADDNPTVLLVDPRRESGAWFPPARRWTREPFTPEARRSRIR